MPGALDSARPEAALEDDQCAGGFLACVAAQLLAARTELPAPPPQIQLVHVPDLGLQSPIPRNFLVIGGFEPKGGLRKLV